MDNNTRQALASAVEQLITDQLRSEEEGTDDVSLTALSHDSGCWYPFELLDGMDFDGDVSIMTSIWSEKRIASINSGADPTPQELHQWRIERARKELSSGDDCIWTYMIFYVRADPDCSGYALVIEPMWYSFDHWRPRPKLVGVFETISDAKDHLRTIGVVND